MGKLTRGKNDLATKSPQVAKEWDFEKNYPLTPADVCNSSTTVVWWKCPKGHSWQAKVDTRTQRTRPACPVCTNQLVISGCNDFATVYPELLHTWDYEKNDVAPETVSAGYSKGVWWICEKKHSWRTSVANRKRQKECPYCSGRKVLSGYNDLQTKLPGLIKEWDFERNTIDPATVGAGSIKKAWWLCSRGHRWEAAIASRAKGVGCPICANQQVLSGYNDFLTTFPELALEWDYAKNIDIDPTRFTAGSETYAWWLCSKGHSWRTMICSRTQGYGCPVCAKEYKTSFPEQAVFYYCKQYFGNCINGYSTEWLGKSELDIFIPSIQTGIEYDGRAWHKSPQKDLHKNQLCDKNGIKLYRLREPGLTAVSEKDILIGSLSYKDLEVAIRQLLLMLGIQNPVVDIDADSNKIFEQLDLREKKSSLACCYPDIALQWDYSKNSSTLLPETVNCKSKTKVWWLCPINHSYAARIDHRTLSGSGCPYCAGRRHIDGESIPLSQSPEPADK